MESTNDPPDPIEEPLPPASVPAPVPAPEPIIPDTTNNTAVVTRRIRRCGLCREPDHTIRTCPQIDIRKQAHLDFFLQFMLRHDICTKERAMRFRYPYLMSRPTIELKCIARTYRHPVEIMDHRDMYRALKRNYIDITISGLEDYYLQRSLQYYSQLYSTITFIERIIHRGESFTREIPQISTSLYESIYERAQNNMFFQFNIIPKSYGNLIENAVTEPEPEPEPEATELLEIATIGTSSPLLFEPFDCPICMDKICTSTKEIELNCTHRLCTECFQMYIQTMHVSVRNINEPVENAIPKCPLCRRIIHTLKGNRFIIEQTQQSAYENSRDV